MSEKILPFTANEVHKVKRYIRLALVGQPVGWLKDPLDAFTVAGVLLDALDTTEQYGADAFLCHALSSNGRFFGGAHKLYADVLQRLIRESIHGNIALFTFIRKIKGLDSEKELGCIDGKVYRDLKASWVHLLIDELLTYNHWSAK